MTIIKTPSSNAPSVMRALHALGEQPNYAETAEDLVRAKSLILPGVSSAAATMSSLREMALLDPLREILLRGDVPFLGICVGMQVLFEHSEEDNTPCLGVLPGEVRRFRGVVRVPQMGWNAVRFLHNRADPMLADVPGSDHFYFVNSYYCVPDAPDLTLGKTEYGTSFCSMVGRGHIYGTQFHCEKSGAAGLRLLRNFAACGTCEG